MIDGIRCYDFEIPRQSGHLAIHGLSDAWRSDAEKAIARHGFIDNEFLQAVAFWVD